MHSSVDNTLPKHLRPGDLRPHPQHRKIEGYLPTPTTTAPNERSRKPPALPKGGANPVQAKFTVETTPSDWTSPDGSRSGAGRSDDDTSDAGTSDEDTSDADRSNGDTSGGGAENSKPEAEKKQSAEEQAAEEQSSGEEPLFGEETAPGEEPMTAQELVENAITEGPAVVFENIEVLARASEADYQAARRKLGRETGINLNGLASARREAAGRLAEERKSEKRRELERREVPLIQVDKNRPSREVVDEACRALEAFNDPPEIFERGEGAVRVESPEGGRLGFEDVGKAGFDDLLSRSANFAKETEEGFEHTDLPRRLTKRVRKRVEIPRLKSVSQVPVLRPDGSVFRGPGYDEETEILCRPGPEVDVPPIPESPSGEQLRRATETLKEPFRDFPFVDQASRANLLAAVLTPLLRPLLDGANVPLLIFDATKQGTGKTLLADVVGLIGTGEEPPKMNDPTREAEWRKQLTAQLRKANPVITIDNVKGRISSSALERALTSETYGDRLLGQSRQLELPADVLWIATGNNLRPKGEMTRRCALVRIDAGMVRPWERSGFEHPNLRAWTRAHRGELVAAGLTLVRAWIDRGRPAPSGANLGSFERWTEVAGGVLKCAGIEGFLGNLGELYDTAGREESRWSRLLEAIQKWAQGGHTSSDGGAQAPALFTAKELSEALQPTKSHDGQDFNSQNSGADDPEGDESKEVLEQIRTALPGKLRGQLRDGEPIARGLGKHLGNRKGQRFSGGWYVRREGQGRKGTRWAVCRDGPSGTASSSRSSSADKSSADKSSAERPPAERSPSPGRGAAPKSEGPRAGSTDLRDCVNVEPAGSAAWPSPPLRRPSRKETGQRGRFRRFGAYEAS